MDSETGEDGAVRGLRIMQVYRMVDGQRERRFRCEVNGRVICVLREESEAGAFWSGYRCGVEATREAWAAAEAAREEASHKPRRFWGWLRPLGFLSRAT